MTNDLQTIQRQIEAVQRSVDTPREKNQARKTIFHDLLTAKVPDSDRAMERLVDEAQILLMAGTFTTANTLVAITFYLLKSPDVLKKLKAELDSALPGTEESFTLPQIETLPYLVRRKQLENEVQN
jgi:cytochrome P450